MEQFLNRWWPACNTTFVTDLEAVIATEVEKSQESKPSSQAKLDNSFDRERFEAMFRAVVARDPHWAYNYCIIETEKALAKLDAYYATKEGGENGI